jgi:hypothetical protein
MAGCHKNSIIIIFEIYAISQFYVKIDWQDHKGFDKPDFREISKWYPQYSTTVVTTEYLKNNKGLIFTVPN